MIVGIVCHVEVLKLNHEAIVWQIILPDYYSYATKLIFGGAYIRTSSETQGQSVGPGEKARQKFSSMLENFCRTFSPFPTDCPWVSKDDIRREICPPPIILTGTFSGHGLLVATFFTLLFCSFVHFRSIKRENYSFMASLILVT